MICRCGMTCCCHVVWRRYHSHSPGAPCSKQKPQNLLTSDLPDAQRRMPCGNYGVGRQISCMSSLHPLVVMTKMPGLEARKISDHEISQPSLCIAVADVGRCVAELPQIMRVATMCDFDAALRVVRHRSKALAHSDEYNDGLSTLCSTVQVIIIMLFRCSSARATLPTLCRTNTDGALFT